MQNKRLKITFSPLECGYCSKCFKDKYWGNYVEYKSRFSVSEELKKLTAYESHCSFVNGFLKSTVEKKAPMILKIFFNHQAFELDVSIYM